MLSYPSIHKNIIDAPIYAFDKHDGSNIRVEWTRKAGFIKFGSRTRLITPEHAPLGESISIFQDVFAEPLTPVFKDMKTERVTLFLEFFGKNSFAGHHEEEEHMLSLFDVSVFKKGFMLPQEFIETFESIVPTAPLLYHGTPTEEFIESVKTGSLPGMSFEGVVCKSQDLVKNKHVKFKVKNQEWLNSLKNYCQDDEDMFNRLS